MKTIDNKIKRIILEEGEQIEIASLKGNNTVILISFKNGSFHIDDVAVEKINKIKEEDQAIKIMQDYLEKNPHN